MSRLAWLVTALGAVSLIVALALTGGRGGPGLEPFTPKGLMPFSIESVREIDVTAPHGHWHFVRAQDGWRTTQGTTTAGYETRVDSALTFLRNSGPERVLTDAEVKQVDATQFGLMPPRLRIVVSGREASVFAISFGAANPMGLSHYTKVDGSSEIALLPAFVGEEWERVGVAP